MTLRYNTPTVSAEWSQSRETHEAVAMAIHAIADASRSPEKIWEAPTSAEWDQVTMAVANYIANDVFPAEPDGRYPWGMETVTIPAAEASGQIAVLDDCTRDANIIGYAKNEAEAADVFMAYMQERMAPDDFATLHRPTYTHRHETSVVSPAFEPLF